MFLFKKKPVGFTLIELSIVLVIIGLIVAGVLVGKDLIRQGQLRLLITEQRNFEVAINTFRAKYDAIPGDFDNAFMHFGTDCAATAALCNGNGDKEIAEVSTEPYRGWQHLALSGILDGNYTGVRGNDPYYGYTIPKENVPVVMNSGEYTVELNSPSSAVYGRVQIALEINARTGALGRVTTGLPTAGYLIPQEAFSIEQKIDDEDPTTGRMIFRNGYQATTTCNSGSDFTFSNTTEPTCRSLYYVDY